MTGITDEHIEQVENTNKTLSEVICIARRISHENGNIMGNCIFCGQYTDQGYYAKLKANFTGYPYLQAGEVICPFCYEMYNNEEYRKNMWIATNEEFRFFKRAEAKEILLSTLLTPFAIYLTKTWKKQGWITLMNKINYDTKNFFVGFDYDVILVERKKLIEYLSLISELLEKKISKTELATGQLKVRSFEKIDMDLELQRRIAMLAGDKLWELCLFVSGGKKKENGRTI
jgi:hypothetical protein